MGVEFFLFNFGQFPSGLPASSKKVRVFFCNLEEEFVIEVYIG